jgi:hypothetical protein
VGAVVVVVGSQWVAWNLLPGVKECLSIFCGDFDAGGMDVFGDELLTAAQTALTALALVVGGYLLARAVLPAGWTWTAVGAGLLVLVVAVSLALPSRVVGAAPTRPCSSPGQDGPVPEACVVGSPPTDDRVPQRGLLLLLGVCGVLLGLAADRRRSEPRRAGRVTIGGGSGMIERCACSDAPPPSKDGGLYLPTAGSDAMMDALFRGPLVVRDDCVLTGDPGDFMIPIWREGFTAGRDENGRVVVRDADGATVAIEGSVFEMGGGFIAEFEPKGKVEPRDAQLEQVAETTGNAIPDRCLGTGVYGVWWVGETQPLSA